MRETRQSGSEGGAAQTNAPFLPLSRFQRKSSPFHRLMGKTSPVRSQATGGDIWRVLFSCVAGFPA